MNNVERKLHFDAITDFGEELQQRFSRYEKCTIQEASAEMAEIKTLLDSIKDVKSYYQKIYDHLRMTRIPEIMDAGDINTVTLEDIGRVTLASDIFASIPAKCKPEAWDWLRDNNHGGIIQETINAGTLKATLKAMIKRGETPPEQLFKITPFTRASITKIK